MSYQSKNIGFTFRLIQPTKGKVIPVAQDTANSFDWIANLVSLKRLRGESNADFKLRIWDASIHQGTCLYSGVVNNMGRDLGFLRRRAIKIDITRDGDGFSLANSPRVEMLANKIVLYSDWRYDYTPTIDREIRIYGIKDDGHYLEDLVAKINESIYFVATLYDNVRPKTFSNLLVRLDTNLIIYDDLLLADRHNTLSADTIVPGSMRFTDPTVFENEEFSTLEHKGDYYVDYRRATIDSFSMPSGNSTCSYHTNAFPVDVDYVPIQIYTLQDDNFVDELFYLEDLNGETQRLLPNGEGSEIIHQLFLETEVFWGE